MTLLAVRDKLRRATGNRSFPDEIMDDFIRDGQRLLDSLDDSTKTEFTTDVNLATGATEVLVTSSRAVQTVWLLDDTAATGTITLLGLPLTGETMVLGATAYRFVFTATLPNDVVIDQVGPDFVEITAANLSAAINKGPGEGTAYGAGTGANVSVTASAASGSAPNVIITVTAIIAGTAGNSIIFTEAVTVDRITVSGTGTLTDGVAGELVKIAKRTFDELVLDFPKQEAEDAGTPEKYAVFPENASDLTTRLKILPPADKRYTIKVKAKHFEGTLSLDSDTNFWTETYSDLLVKASKYEIAVFFDNEKDMALQLSAVNLGLQGILFNQAQEDQADRLEIIA